MPNKPDPHAPTMLESPLCRIAALAEQIRALTSEQDLAVARARASGATWAEIARALGCSAQAANKRYRWVRHNEHPPQVWFERPLPI
jgi:DNA invertase Pin-like site-specific DNA recombinase